MKKILALALALVLVLSLAACGGKDKPAPAGSSTPAPAGGNSSSGTSQREKASDEDYLASVLDYVKGRHSDATFIYYDDSSTGIVLTVWACDPVPDNSDACTTTSYWGYYGRTSAYERDKNAELIGANVEKSTVDVTWNDDLLCYSYEMPSTWANEESRAGDYTVAQKRGESTGQSQGGDASASKPEETTGTDAPTPSGDAGTVADFLKLYGWTEDNLKPEHFIEFGELDMDGSTKAGQPGSMGFIKITVDKDATTPDDVDAWFEAVYGKMQELSTDGKLYKGFNKEKEAEPLAELMAGPLWADFPGGGCSYPYKLEIGESMIYVATSYDYETGTYKMSIGVK